MTDHTEEDLVRLTTTLTLPNGETFTSIENIKPEFLTRAALGAILGMTRDDLWEQGLGRALRDLGFLEEEP